MSLVCRDWASLCQWKLFNDLTIRSHEDLCIFQDIFTTNRIKQQDRLEWGFIFQRRVRLVPDIRGQPWLHLALPVLSTREHEARVTLDASLMRADTEKTRLPLRSMLNYLPRALPRAYAYMIRDLEMKSVRFSDGEELVRFLGSLPSLSTATLYNLAWDALPTSETFMDCQKRAGHERIATLRTEDNFPLSLWLLPVIPINLSRCKKDLTPKGYIRREDCVFLITALQQLYRQNESVCSSEVAIRASEFSLK